MDISSWTVSAFVPYKKVGSIKLKTKIKSENESKLKKNLKTFLFVGSEGITCQTSEEILRLFDKNKKLHTKRNIVKNSWKAINIGIALNWRRYKIYCTNYIMSKLFRNIFEFLPINVKIWLLGEWLGTRHQIQVFQGFSWNFLIS